MGSVVVDDFDLLGVGASPAEADAPPVIDADGVLTAPVAAERLEAIAGRHREKGQFDGRIDELKLNQSALPNLAGHAARAAGHPQLLGVAISEALDHTTSSAESDYPASR